jgi:hypothetical protein
MEDTTPTTTPADAAEETVAAPATAVDTPDVGTDVTAEQHEPAAAAAAVEGGAEGHTVAETATAAVAAVQHAAESAAAAVAAVFGLAPAEEGETSNIETAASETAADVTADSKLAAALQETDAPLLQLPVGPLDTTAAVTTLDGDAVPATAVAHQSDAPSDDVATDVADRSADSSAPAAAVQEDTGAGAGTPATPAPASASGGDSTVDGSQHKQAGNVFEAVGMFAQVSNCVCFCCQYCLAQFCG